MIGGAGRLGLAEVDLALAVPAGLDPDQPGQRLDVPQRSRAAMHDVAEEGRTLLDLALLGAGLIDQIADDEPGRGFFVGALDLGPRELGQRIAAADPQRRRPSLDALD